MSTEESQTTVALRIVKAVQRGAYLRCADLLSGHGGESNPVILEQTFRRWADEVGEDDG